MRPERPLRRRSVATTASNRGGDGSTTDPIPADRSDPGSTREVSGVADADSVEPQVDDAPKAGQDAAVQQAPDQDAPGQEMLDGSDAAPVPAPAKPAGPRSGRGRGRGAPRRGLVVL